jgi:D-tyrosyl-tRNA(Tyr) deacylase
MKAVIQRVSRAKVDIDGKTVGSINAGLLVLVAICETDGIKEIEWMSNKIVNLRVFPDDEDKMNRSVIDINGGILFISNFTVYGDVKKGFRPNFMKSASAEISEPLYKQMLDYMRSKYSITIEAGEFGAMMNIELVNDGPVTIIIEKEFND